MAWILKWYKLRKVEFKLMVVIIEKKNTFHRCRCLHTYEENGMVELRNRRIIEHRLALMFHSNVPIEFWIFLSK